MVSLMQRRREMMIPQAGGTWNSISGNSFLSWGRGPKVAVSGTSVHFYPSSLGWAQTLTANALQFKWGQIKNGILHFSCDYKITGIASNGDVPFSVGTYSTQNPSASETRLAYTSIADLTADGEDTLDITIPINSLIFTSGTPSDNDYFGMRIYAHTGANSHLYISNLIFEVQI